MYFCYPYGNFVDWQPILYSMFRQSPEYSQGFFTPCQLQAYLYPIILQPNNMSSSPIEKSTEINDQKISNDGLKSDRKSENKAQKTKKLNKQKKKQKQEQRLVKRKDRLQKQRQRNSSIYSNRNIIPNQIYQLTSFLTSRRKSEAIVKRLFEKYNHDHNCTINRFFYYQSYIKSKDKYKGSPQNLRMLAYPFYDDYDIFDQLEQDFYLKINRILISLYFKSTPLTSIMASNKMGTARKLEHLKTRRMLHEKINQFLEAASN